MNYVNQFLQMIDVEAYEEFKLKGQDRWLYRINNICCLEKKDIILDSEWAKSQINISNIITGTFSIVKLKNPKTEAEQLAIKYARAGGFNYLVKDKDNVVVAYETEPIRGEKHWFKENPKTKAVEIALPISFIKWEDEPYYIGD